MSEHLESLDIAQLSRYQTLSEKFIETHIKRLNIPNICQYQNLSIDFIKKYKDKLSFASLALNDHYNKSDTIQILSNGQRWFVIDLAPVSNFADINFITDI